MTERESVKNAEQTLREHETHFRGGERSRATVEKHIRDVRKLMGFLAEDADIGREEIREHREMLKEQYKITNADSMLAAMNRFFVSLEREELEVKLFRIRRNTYSRSEREVTERNYVGLIKTARADGDERMSTLLQTPGSTGVRISELKFVMVKTVNKGQAETYSKGKLCVVLPPAELMRLLKLYCKKVGVRSGSIFITRNRNTMDRSNISRRMKQLGREAGANVAKVFPHNLRHLPTRAFYGIKKNVVWLMDLLGHSNISATRIYTMTMEE